MLRNQLRFSLTLLLKEETMHDAMSARNCDPYLNYENVLEALPRGTYS